MELMEMVRSYLPLGIIAVVVFAGMIGIGYGLIYRKILKGSRQIGIGKLIWLVLFCGYLFVVCSLTLLDRGGGYKGRFYPLFASYKEAWYEFSMQDWRNLILNIILFVPFGFLLPAGIRWMQHFYRTTLCGLIFTLAIELTQFAAGRGVAEWDDVLNNTLGAMIGYGLFCIFYAVFLRKKQQEKLRVGVVLCCQIPLLLTCLSYALIFGIYAGKDLGNLRSEEVTAFRKGSIQVSSDLSYDSSVQELAVYELQKRDRQECEEYAAQFFENLGDELDKDETIFYDTTDVFLSKKGNHFWMDVEGLTWDYTDFDSVFWGGDEEEDDREADNDTASPVTDAKEADIRACLEGYQVTLPTEAVFEKGEEGNYKFKVSNLIKDDRIYDGELDCTYYSNGKMESIYNQIRTGTYYGSYPAISEQEAYERLCAGRFYLWNASADSYEITVDQVTLCYQKDSKGFYQPVYDFTVKINGEEDVIEIPALK